MRAQRACRQPHGTNAMYTAGCDCLECRAAHADYVRRGSEHRIVPVGLAVRELRRLLKLMSLNGIESASGVRKRALKQILDGERKYGVTRETFEAIRGVREPAGGNHYVAVGRTRGYLDRLRRRTTMKEVARQSGVKYNTLRSMRNPERKWVLKRHADAVRAVALRYGVAQDEVDEERFAELRTRLLVGEVASCLGISDRTAWRVETKLQGRQDEQSA